MSTSNYNTHLYSPKTSSHPLNNNINFNKSNIIIAIPIITIPINYIKTNILINNLFNLINIVILINTLIIRLILTNISIRNHNPITNPSLTSPIISTNKPHYIHPPNDSTHISPLIKSYNPIYHPLRSNFHRLYCLIYLALKSKILNSFLLHPIKPIF